MPDRIIRDELLRSDRYVKLSSDTLRTVFIHLILTVDSLGNTEATTTMLSAIMSRTVEQETGARWLAELADCDLVRLYDHGGKRYLHIPRFRQRLRYRNGKHPRPPRSIECKEMNELLKKVGPQSDSSQSTVGPQSAEVKRSEVKRSEDIAYGVQTPHSEVERPHANTSGFNSHNTKKGNGTKPYDPPWDRDEIATEAKARELGMWPARAGEEWEPFRARIRAAIAERMRS